jgi:hypothetical protein
VHAVGAFGDFDEKRVGAALGGVVLEQPGAETAGFYADGVVYGRVVGGVTFEDIDGDAVLLELLVGVRQGVLEDVPEKELAAECAAEGARGDDAIKLSLDGAVVRQRGCGEEDARSSRARVGA